MTPAIAFYIVGPRSTWSIRDTSGLIRTSGVQDIHPMPLPIDCPVVVVDGQVIPWVAFREVMQEHLHLGEPADVPALVAALQEIGCTVEDGNTFKLVTAVKIPSNRRRSTRRRPENIIKEIGY